MSTSTSTTNSADKVAAAAYPNKLVTAITHNNAPTETSKPQSEPNFLHSPPDSNNVARSDGSGSELSDLDDEPILSDAPQPGAGAGPANNDDTKPDEPSDDIGEVLPDHWSGMVPVFKPTMHQFKDFKRFVGCLLTS